MNRWRIYENYVFISPDFYYGRARTRNNEGD